MESIKDLNMEANDMQVVLSALERVNRRIKEVAQTHKPLFGGEHFLTGKEVCERLYVSPRTLQDYRDRRIIPYTRPLQNLTPFSIILVFELYWLTCSLYF